MIIVIDGHDLSGKSTILKHFKNYPIIKMPVTKEVNNQIELCSFIFNRTIVQFKKLIKTNTIFFDRWFLSSIVYGKFFYRQFDLNYINEVYDELKKCIVYLNIYCSDDEINKRYIKRNDRLYNPTIIKSIKFLYLQEGLRFNTMNLMNETGLDLKLNIERIKKYAK